MDFDEIMVKENPGLCRCCLSEGCYKDLSSEYSWMSETEVYADMLFECFDISISQHTDGPNGPNRLICEVCITRLRDACNFKKQVLDSEKKFVDMMAKGDFQNNKAMLYQSQMKAEMSEIEVDQDTEHVDFLDDDLDYDDIKTDDPSMSGDITVAALPIKNKRGRPRKNATVVKSEKKTKLPKTEEKPRSSKVVTKGAISAKKAEKTELLNLMTFILENSTVMPFRWFGNKYVCFFCCCTFVETKDLKEHTKHEHNKPRLKNVMRFLVSKGKVKFDISEITCKNCPKAIIDIRQFLSHSTEHHDMVCNWTGFIDRLLCYNLEKMKCLQCGEEFRFFGPLLKHEIKYHPKSGPYLCEVCGQGFESINIVKYHKIRDHSEPSAVACVRCSESFPNDYHLKKHVISVHKPDRLKCPKCAELFRTTYLLKRHMTLSHEQNKGLIFNCDSCPKFFCWKSKLINHVKRVHLKEKTFSCEICGFRGFSRDVMKRHMISHDDSRPYKCHYCEKAFQRKKTLDFHIRIHTNDKRYTCQECGKAFIQLSSLKLHCRLHHPSNTVISE